VRYAGLRSGEVLDLLDRRAIPNLIRPQSFPSPRALGDGLNGQVDHVRLSVRRLKRWAFRSMVFRPSAEAVFNLEVFNGMAVAQDLGQPRPQLGDAPLKVAQVVDKAVLRLFVRGAEVPAQGGIGRKNPRVLVENDEGSRKAATMFLA
jgi:hypothetical protein